MTDQAGTLIKGRYRLLRLLGEGGVAEVWLARDEGIDRLVALKRLRPQYARDDKLLERFRREARAIAQLDSPHIVQVYDVDVTPAERYIAMEYVEGQDLREVLRQEGPLPVTRALALMRDVAAGVAVAHQAGLVHRDLKPGNVLLSAEGRVKITDFGIARDVAGAGLTEPGTVWGTSHYIAPEQAMGRPVSPATDVYSMGVMLFEMLTGRLPYPGDDPVAIAIAHIQEPVPSVQQWVPTLPAGVGQLVARMMAKEPTQRLPDGAAVERILARYLTGSDQATVLRQAVEPPAPDPTRTVVRPVVAPDPSLVPLEADEPVREHALPPRRRPLVSGALLAFVALCLLVGLAGALASGALARLAGNGGGAEATPAGGVELATAPVPTFTAAAATPAPTETPPATATPAPIPTATAITIVLSGPRSGNGPDARALRLAEGRIEVDGSLREWERSQPVPLVRPVVGEDRWTGQGDLSGTAYFAWDDRFLYLAVERTDDEHLQTRSGYDLYRDDAVELWLDADLWGDLNESGANRDDFQFAFSAGDFRSLKAEGVAYHPDRDDQRNRELRVRAEPLPTGYTLEARIPWEVLDAQPAPNAIFGYAVVLNDNDSPQSEEPQTQVASNLEAPYLKPLTFGNLVLMP